MRYFSIAMVLLFLFACRDNNRTQDLFKKSFKQQGQENRLPEFSEYLDTIKNIYSNYKYHVAFNGPDTWESDKGVSEHTIYRTYNPDSALTFSINVIELNVDENLEQDMWQYYLDNKQEIDNSCTTIIEAQLNTKVEDYRTEKTYVKNNVALKRTLRYLVKEQDYEYYVTSLSRQVMINKLIFTFGLDLPSVFYDGNKSYYDDLFLNISFLKNTELINQLINKKK